MSNQQENTYKQSAREWLIKLHAEDCDGQMQQEFVSWLRAKPQHSAAFYKVYNVWELVGGSNVAHSKLRNILDRELHTPTFYENLIAWTKQPRIAMAYSTAMLCIGAVLFSLLVPLWKGTSPVIYHNTSTLTQVFNLTDGSSITLRPGSYLEVILGEHRRTVNMRYGRAYFDVAKVAEKPFKVVVGNTEIRVTGTEFGVRKDNSEVTVVVTEGKVNVVDLPIQEKQTADEIRALIKGQKIIAGTDGAISATQTFNVADELTWLDGRLTYDNAPLADVITDLNAYQGSNIRFLEPSLSTRKVTTSFTIEQSTQILDVLAEAYNLEVITIGERTLLKSKEED